MKLLHVIASCNPDGGGPVEGVLRLHEAFEAAGHSSEMLTLDRPDDPWVSDCPMPVHAKGAPAPDGSGPLASLRRWARRSPEAVNWLADNLASYDGVIVDGLWNYATRAARLVLPGSGIPYVVFPHGMLDPWFREQYPLKDAVKRVLWRVNEGPLMHAATAGAFTCERELELARGTWKPWGVRGEIVGYGTSVPPFAPGQVEAFRKLVPEIGERPYLLFMSRLHPKKGCEILLDAFEATLDQHDYALVMAGPGDDDYRQALLSRQSARRAGERIAWPGMLQGDAKWGALQGCEAMALISHQENFGVIVAEALACSRPVVISDQVNIAPEIVRARAGIVCATDVDGAAAAIREIASLEASERDAMGERGRKLFEQQFEIVAVAARLIELLSIEARAAK
ncbi:glycosyltransferase [Erythrobacter sp. HKB08]|uniref:glycosyltransferase n=1 Tax=Erythrobacter sp. HKB08 TaxID=2502843 RepID=UPI001008A72F|nr:glycosyltransferase [Erythrobacter sp. HKB08]